VAAVPTGLVVAGVAYWLLFAAWQGFWAVAGLQHARSRDEWLEAAGAAVPVAAGLLIAAAALTAPAPVSVALAVVAMPVMVLGRAVYELVVFRSRG
jgi:ABC-type phosphate transport system permease subunit